MARLYSNENFPFPVVIELRRMGHDILTTLETGKANQAVTDDQSTTLCTNASSIVVALRDIVCTFDADFAGQAQRIHSAIEQADSLDGKLLRINRPVR